MRVSVYISENAGNYLTVVDNCTDIDLTNWLPSVTNCQVIRRAENKPINNAPTLGLL